MIVGLSRAFFIAVLAVGSACSLALVNEDAQIATHEVAGQRYYHLLYTLTRDNVESIDQLAEQAFYENGGQFEVGINRALFPVRSPHCQSHIKLRMPWVKGGDSLDKKYALYQAIAALNGGRSDGGLAVAIELNPYVAEDEQGPYLTQCNVFFRSRSGEYIAPIQP